MKIKNKYKAKFMVWLQDRNGIIELAEDTWHHWTIELPSIYDDYLKEKAIVKLEELDGLGSWSNMRIINYKLIEYKKL